MCLQNAFFIKKRISTKSIQKVILFHKVIVLQIRITKNTVIYLQLLITYSF